MRVFGVGLRGSGFGLSVSVFGVRVSGGRFHLSGSAFPVSGSGFRVSGFGPQQLEERLALAQLLLRGARKVRWGGGLRVVECEHDGVQPVFRDRLAIHRLVSARVVLSAGG